MSPQIAYFFRKIYGNIIKWWFVIYNPIARRIWPSKEEEEEALKKEAEEKEEEASEEEEDIFSDDSNVEEPAMNASPYEAPMTENAPPPMSPSPSKQIIADDNYNATTGAYSGLYGTGPVDSTTQSMLDEIMGKNNAAHSIDNLIPGNEPDFSNIEVNEAPPEDQSAVLEEANAIYERLMREAAEDEAKKQAEIEAAKAAQV